MSISFYGKDSTQKDAYGYPRCIPIPEGTTHHMNLANANGAAFLRFLGLEPYPHGDGDLCGEVSIPEARHAVIFANARFDSRVDDFTRATQTSGHVEIDGVVQLHVPRVTAFGIDREYFRRQLDRFAGLLEELVRLGATHIYWA